MRYNYHPTRSFLRINKFHLMLLSLCCTAIFVSCSRQDKDQLNDVKKETELADVYSKKSGEIISKVDVEPSYPGGSTAWSKFLFASVKYPQEAIDKEITGTVIVEFIVDKNGDIHDVKASQGPAVLAEEAVRVIKKSGKWVPAEADGKTVTTYKKQPISFRLERDDQGR